MYGGKDKRDPRLKPDSSISYTQFSAARMGGAEIIIYRSRPFCPSRLRVQLYPAIDLLRPAVVRLDGEAASKLRFCIHIAAQHSAVFVRRASRAGTEALPPRSPGRICGSSVPHPRPRACPYTRFRSGNRHKCPHPSASPSPPSAPPLCPVWPRRPREDSASPAPARFSSVKLSSVRAATLSPALYAVHTSFTSRLFAPSSRMPLIRRSIAPSDTRRHSTDCASMPSSSPLPTAAPAHSISRPLSRA